jgi:hypothetical protein
MPNIKEPNSIVKPARGVRSRAGRCPETLTMFSPSWFKEGKGRSIPMGRVRKAFRAAEIRLVLASLSDLS